MSHEESKLLSDLSFWQKQLRLQDWNVKLVYCSNIRCHGLSRKVSDYKEAEIKIAAISSLPETCLGNNDLEVTLVHELLHIQAEQLDDFIASDQGKKYQNDNERFIELTAIALVSLRRSAEPGQVGTSKE